MPINWVQFAYTNFPDLAGVGGAGAVGSIIDSKWTDIRGCWGASGNSVRSIPVLSGGGGYSQANPPTGQTNTPSGTALRKTAATWIGVVNGSGVVTAIVMLTMGHGFLPAGNGTASLSSTGATITHNGGSGLTLDYANAVLTGNLVRGIASGTAESSTGLGSHNWLLAPVTNMSVQQRVISRQWLTASTDVLNVDGRVNEATKQCYSALISTGASTAYRIWIHNDYQSGGGSKALEVVGQPALPVNRLYETELILTGSAPTSLQLTLRDITDTPTVVFTSSVVTDNTAGLQSAGRAGLGLAVSLNAPTKELLVYTEAAISVTPSTVPMGATTSLTLGRIGGTPWDGSTSFAPSGGTGVGLSSLSLFDDSSATVLFNSGTATGAVTISGGGLSGTVFVSPILAPALTLGMVDGYSLPVTIAAAPQYAVPPLTCECWRSQNSGFDPATDSTAVRIGNQTGLSAGVVPSPLTALDMPTGVSFLRTRIIDANGQAVLGAQSVATIYSDTDLAFVAEGDSIVRGHASPGMTRWATDLYVLTPGSGNTSITVTITNHKGGRGAVIGDLLIQGGQLIAASMDQHGDGYDEANYPTLSVVANGVAPTLELVPGGGWPLALEAMLRARFGLQRIKAINVARGGTATGSWDSAGQLALRSNLAAGDGTQTPFALICLGPNDANSGLVTGSIYQTRLQNVVDRHLGLGRRTVCLIPPLYWLNGTQANNADLQEYGRRCDAIADANPNRVRVIGRNLFALFADHPEYFSDGLHLSTIGTVVFAGAILDEVADVMGLTVPPGDGGPFRSRFRTLR